MVKKRVYAYYDGSNFYHFIRNNYGFVNVNYFDITNHLLDLGREELLKIKYFNSPVNQQENPDAYASQQKFFARLKKTPLLELFLGRLVKRPLNKLNINCLFGCGHQKATDVKCPQCGKDINMSEIYHWFVTSGQSLLSCLGRCYISEHAQKSLVVRDGLPNQDSMPPACDGWFLTLQNVIKVMKKELM